MSIKMCLTCGEYMFSSGHVCSPEWLVWQLDDPERSGATTVRACDAQEAVEKWAEREDGHGDYWIVQGGCPIVCVQRLYVDDMHGREARSGQPVEYLAVEGESVPQYHAQPMRLADFKRELRSLVLRRSFFEAGRLYGQMHEIF